MVEQQDQSPDAVVARVAEKLAAQRARLSGERPGSKDVAEQPSPQADVTPTVTGNQDVEPESSPGAEPKDSDKELNFKRLREERDRERRLRENTELELAEMRRAQREAEKKTKDEDRSKMIWEALQEGRPEGFDEWDQDKQTAWYVNKAMTERLDKEYGAADELRKLLDQNRILRRLPNLDDDQIDKVLEVYQQANGALNEKEALEIAKQREPELFVLPEPPSAPAEGAVPSSHQVMEPSREGVHRAPPDEDAEVNDVLANAFADSPGFMSPGKKDAMTLKMKQMLGKKGFLPGQR